MVSGFHIWFALVGFYLLESIRITTISAVVFCPKLFSSSWTGRRPFIYPGAGRWGWTVAPLVPTRFPQIISQDFILAYGLEYVAPNSALGSSQTAPISYTEIQSLRRYERFVVINGSKYIRCENEDEAETIRTQLNQLRQLPACAREEEIDKITKITSRDTVRETLQIFKDRTRVPRALATILWGVAFIFLPLALTATSNVIALLLALGIIWLLGVAVASALAFAAKQFEQKTKRALLWKSLKYVFYPIAALRVQEDLAQTLLTGTPPIVFCVALCGGRERSRLSRDLLLRVRYPVSLSPGGNSLGESVSDWFNRKLAERIESLLISRAPEVLKDLVPSPGDETCLFYCPRCRAQYTVACETCVDCPGVHLERFAAIKAYD
jgi:hypothetical protein